MTDALKWLTDRMAASGSDLALVWQERPTLYRDLCAQVERWGAELDRAGVEPGEIVALDGDYSPGACSLFVALARRGAIIVPLTMAARSQRDEFLVAAEVRTIVRFDEADEWTLERGTVAARNPLLATLRERGTPGLVLFTSGSTGKSKAALHDLAVLLEKFKVERQRKRTLTFLLLDHIGGVNTLFYTLANGGSVVSVSGRDPEVICAAIAAHRVQLLPTSPTFLNMLLISEAYRRHDLSSLELITYGTEVMLESTLHRVHEVFPGVRLQQTYGLSELGILRSSSRASDSLWVRVGGEDYETKVVSGTLRIRARTAMLGYLNAPSPFDAEGWMDTQDVVETDGEYLRILGRRSEIVNVGGQKVYPAEVESVLLEAPNVRDVTVSGAPNPITGQVVVARVNLVAPEDAAMLRARLRAHCRARLAQYKIPAKIEVVDHEQFNARFKRLRVAE